MRGPQNSVLATSPPLSLTMVVRSSARDSTWRVDMYRPWRAINVLSVRAASLATPSGCWVLGAQRLGGGASSNTKRGGASAPSLRARGQSRGSAPAAVRGSRSRQSASYVSARKTGYPWLDVLRQPPQAQPQHPRGQVAHPARRRQSASCWRSDQRSRAASLNAPGRSVELSAAMTPARSYEAAHYTRIRAPRKRA